MIITDYQFFSSLIKNKFASPNKWYDNRSIPDKKNKYYNMHKNFFLGKINEVNLLNGKLLFTNKLFKAYSLSEGQKLKVIETFDRAKNIREVKLVYSTLAESILYRLWKAGGIISRSE